MDVNESKYEEENHSHDVGVHAVTGLGYDCVSLSAASMVRETATGMLE